MSSEYTMETIPTSPETISGPAKPRAPTPTSTPRIDRHSSWDASANEEADLGDLINAMVRSSEDLHERLENTQDKMDTSARRSMSSPIAERPAKRRRISVSQVSNVNGNTNINSNNDTESENEGDDITVESTKPKYIPGSEPHTLSDSDAEETPEPEQSILTSRPRTRRQAALKSQSATASQYKASPGPASSSRPKAKASNKPNAKNKDKTSSKPKSKEKDKGKGKGKGKEKGKEKHTAKRNQSQSRGNGKIESKASAKKGFVVEVDEDGYDEDYECPCGYGCSTISFCEGRKKEMEIRDVGMSVILSCKTMVKILVGPPENQESFIIHKDLLALHSDYFAALFRQTPFSQPFTSSFTSKAGSSALPNIGSSSTEIQQKEHLPTNNQEEGADEKSRNRVVKKNFDHIKMEEADESDEDIEMISSDQYYATVSKKKLITPDPTPTKPKSTTKCAPSSPNYAPTSSSHTTSSALPSLNPSTLTLTLPPNITPLPFSLFQSFIYTGSLTPSLLLLTDPLESCTWEKLWKLGFLLGSKGFVNFCMEGLRELRVLRRGEWPKVKEVRGVWGMVGTWAMGEGDQTMRDDAEKKKLCLEDKDTPLHHFTAACIAYNAPLSSLAKGTVSHNAWTRALSSRSGALEGLSIAVLGVERELVSAGKKPWDDGFRELWRVDEGGLGERWREIVEAQIGGEVAKGSVKDLLDGMALRGESGLDDLGDKEGSESERACRDESEESEDEVFEEDERSGDDGEEDRYERLDGRYERYGKRSRK